jgi:hypothetical protein
MHGGWQLFSTTLLVEVKESLLIRWVALYTLASVLSRGEREKHTCTHALLDWAWRSEAIDAGA